MVAQAGKARTAGLPSMLSDTPSTPVLSKRSEPTCVVPRNVPSGPGLPVSDSAGLAKSESSPQYRAGCAMKICRPLPTSANRQATLSQCMIRTGSRCR